MNRVEARLEALEAATRRTRIDVQRAASTVRFLAGTATIDDYEEFFPGLLDYTAAVVLLEASRV